MQEFAVLEEQLNGVERYAMKYIEAESFEKTEQQLREAEVGYCCYLVITKNMN